jgi:hypothetical protein
MPRFFGGHASAEIRDRVERRVFVTITQPSTPFDRAPEQAARMLNHLEFVEDTPEFESYQPISTHCSPPKSLPNHAAFMERNRSGEAGDENEIDSALSS